MEENTGETVAIDGIVGVTSAADWGTLSKFRVVSLRTVNFDAHGSRMINFVASCTDLTEIVAVEKDTERVLSNTGTIKLSITDVTVKSRRNLYAQVILGSIAYFTVPTDT